jgi:RNA ligase
MHPAQQKLYDNLIALTKANEAFYYQDFELDGKKYRIFNYRLASYTDFQQPGALECRGVMFEVQDEVAVRLASLPMEKFFNLNENPMTMNLDLTQVVRIEEKADGSLMSTYIHNDQLRLKSKGSLFSEQALHAMAWLDTQPRFKEILYNIASKGFTVNLEWCAPQHRIVIGYMEPHLKILNIRSEVSGAYQDLSQELKEYWIKSVETNDPAGFVSLIPGLVDIEGYVIQLVSGQRVKIKCEWYLSLHHAKDSVNNPRRLFEAILDEGIDDLRSLFYADPLAMRTIDEMQVKVDHVYNHMVRMVEDYYNENKHLDRKTYAINGQLHFKDTIYFGLAMNKYSGKAVNYKEFLKGKWREIGLKDTSLDDKDS